VRIRPPKRIRLGLRQKRHGHVRDWMPSWVVPSGSGLGGLNAIFRWAYGRQCGSPKGNHGSPCACGPDRIADMINSNNAILERLRR
jgi:hypothetical protein